eukprot:CAMPEP_0201714878 /NCGR_PEP_ID=MMETSP0593-20130828/1161_1 /ASSEMBLY_ACC=CAM_ASM_000672 /TAXON_ID=267983 /ORGANISM="Skeletonema japonicum, Strain CCMP2506" /LENGTH=372 /DNA_ID=CAMNT_0048204191 /DNA_START=215 /DNA_END=1333 /DNA_ORIENTATION=-
MTSLLTHDFDSEAGTSTSGRYGKVDTNDNKLPLEISSGNDDDDHQPTDTTLSLSAKYRQEKHQTKLRHWKESEYAAGLVEPTWADELEKYNREGRSGCCCCCPPSAELNQVFQEEMDPGCGCIYLSAVVCSRLGADRIGNMAVLKSRYVMVEVKDESQGEEDEEAFVNDDEEALRNRNKSDTDGKKNTEQVTKRMVRKREIQFIVGPFWPMLLGITYPLIFGVSGLTLFVGLPYRAWYIKLGWAVLTILLIRALFNTGFRDPGILIRQKDPPENDDEEEEDMPRRRVGFRWGTEGGPWRWSEQAQSYRPRNSSYDTDTAVIVEEFDHTCPWTGTAIGKKNMGSFQMFVGLVFICLIMDIFLLTAPARIEYSN